MRTCTTQVWWRQCWEAGPTPEGIADVCMRPKRNRHGQWQLSPHPRWAVINLRRRMAVLCPPHRSIPSVFSRHAHGIDADVRNSDDSFFSFFFFHSHLVPLSGHYWDSWDQRVVAQGFPCGAYVDVGLPRRCWSAT